VCETYRPLGRLFLCTVLVLALVAASNAAPQTTTVADVIYRADGTPAKGTLLISWGGDNDRNLIGRFGTRLITLPRLSRVQNYFLRQYDASSPANYSEFSTAIYVDYPL